MEQQKKKTGKKKIFIATALTAVAVIGGYLYFKKNPEKLVKIKDCFKSKPDPVVVDTLSVTVSEVLPETPKPHHRHRHHPHRFINK